MNRAHISAKTIGKKMIASFIIFLPILFAVIWAAFIGLRINRLENRDGKRKLINY